MKIKDKIVFILGAGFSKEANSPSQEELVMKIFEIHAIDPNILGDDKIDRFKKFLTETLHLPEHLQKTIPLEDIFTPIDRCIADNISFRNLSVETLKEKRSLLYELIGNTLAYLLEQSDKEYINTFANFLVESSATRKEKKYDRNDPVSVITTNWDILLDNSIYNNIQEKKLSRQYDAVVDYCCYISSYDKSDETVKPGLEVLGRGGFNVKLLKLHGSLNWLQCPRCHRLYVKFNQKIAMNPYNNIDKPSCRHCNNNFNKHTSHNLISNLIMPTFLKDLSNPQYKIVWQNAGIELSEAKRIVFIGYSLPQADFEMRQLLSRMVAENTEIEVVDYERPNTDDKNYKDLIKRYEQFFGRKVTPHNKGAKSYIELMYNNLK